MRIPSARAGIPRTHDNKKWGKTESRKNRSDQKFQHTQVRHRCTILPRINRVLQEIYQRFFNDCHASNRVYKKKLRPSIEAINVYKHLTL